MHRLMWFIMGGMVHGLHPKLESWWAKIALTAAVMLAMLAFEAIVERKPATPPKSNPTP